MFETLKESFLGLTSPFSSVHKHWVNSAIFNSVITKTSQWKGTDNEQNYLVRGNRKYSKTSILYEDTEYGFRTSSTEIFNETLDTIACFGCSHTVGVGLFWEETWPYLLGQKLSVKYNIKNYGQGGGSCDLISRLVYNYLLTNKPKAICCLLPDINRTELFVYRKPIKSGPWVNKQGYEKSVDTEDNWVNNFIKNVKLYNHLYLLTSRILFLNYIYEIQNTIFLIVSSYLK